METLSLNKEGIYYSGIRYVDGKNYNNFNDYV